ncbi:MAG: zinc-binding alcohol dehydrogenase family protein [Armatimonadota bacterium]
MKELVLYSPGDLRFREVPDPKPSAGQALLKVEAVGVCGTDFHAYHGDQPFMTFPRVLGHELGCRVIYAPDNDRGIAPGTLVTVEPLKPCGTCYPCSIGKYNCCRHLQVLGVHTDGGLRELITLPVHMLYPSSKLSAEELAVCEPLSIGLHAVRRAELHPGEAVCIIGAGPIGLSVMLVARAIGARTIVCDVRPERLSMARRLGATERINASGRDLIDAVMTLTAGEGPPVVVEAVGRPDTMELAVELVAFGGRVVVVGLTDRPLTIKPSVFVRKEIDFRGSRNSANAFPEVLQLAESGQINPSALITERAPFHEAPSLFARHPAHQPLCKPVITMPA